MVMAIWSGYGDDDNDAYDGGGVCDVDDDVDDDNTDVDDDDERCYAVGDGGGENECGYNECDGDGIAGSYGVDVCDDDDDTMVMMGMLSMAMPIMRM